MKTFVRQLSGRLGKSVRTDVRDLITVEANADRRSAPRATRGAGLVMAGAR